MDETSKMERDLSSAAAFVEGGIQDACDDACSICLEEFCESDPSTVTDCKHEFHLQCILEWCQRSSQCPMCWQSISLKDSTSQELFEAVERERNIRQNQARTTTIFHHPAFVDFELQHLPISGSDSELEERIMQHLAAAAAMGRVHHISRREGQQGRSGSHRHPQFLVFSPHPNAPYVGYRSASSAQVGENESNPAIFATSSSSIPSASVEEPHITPVPAECNGATVTETSSSQSWFSPSTSSNPGSHLASSIQVSPGPSDLQSFSESLRSRLSAVSMKYKESITKSTRGWREKFFSRNSAVADLGSEVRREPHAGNDSVSHMIDRLQIRENRTGAFPSTDAAHPTIESNNEVVTRSHVNTDPNDSATSAPC